MMDAIYAAFHADWQDPPGTVVKTFRTLSEAEDFCHDEMSGYGYSVVAVPFPSAIVRSKAEAWDEGYAMASDDFTHSDYCGRKCQCEGIHGQSNPYRADGA